MAFRAMRHSAALLLGLGLAAPAYAQDAAITAKFWATCGACHEFDGTGGHSKGPNLWGLMGKTLGTIERFGTYSPAMKAAAANRMVWTPELLDRWLQNPQAVVPSNRMKHWAEVLGDPERPRIGIVWAGSATNKNDHNRSAALADFAALRDLGAEFISLQKELRPADMPACEELGVRHFGTELTDFAETAALLANVDAVVSVDTSVAHLAGALGKDVWILLPFYGLDWRWLLDRNDSPWYPTARLVRQKRDEPWSTTITAALEAIRQAV